MPNESSHITVIVPTRERPDTLSKCLMTLTAQDSDDFTVLVSDNFSQDSTEEIVRAARDPRLVYVNTGRRVSMAHNYEFALSRLVHRSGWVMLIGDDDGMVPGAVLLARELIASSSVDAVHSEVCSYSWPSMTGESYGRLGVPLGVRREERLSEDWLRRVMAGHASYLDLPMLYRGGLIRVSVLDEIKARTGAFYRSCIPDVYSSVAISSCVERYLHVESPLVINGLSGHSIGMSQIRDTGRSASPARKFLSEGIIPFHPDLPLSDEGDLPVGQPLVYEPFLQSSVLRPTWPATMHAQQLELTLATARPESSAFTEAWGRKFARQHGLDFETIRRRARLKSWSLRLRGGRGKALQALATFAVGSPDLPLTDVYQASVAAGTILQAGVGRMRNLSRLLQRGFIRLAERFSEVG